MNVYPYLSIKGFSNCYLVSNEADGKAIVIDPGMISAAMIEKIEEQNLDLGAILITHAHKNHCDGLKTLLKIYQAPIFAAESDIDGLKTQCLRGSGTFQAAGFDVKFTSIPGHTNDSVVFQIGEIIFSGDTILAGKLGKTPNKSFDARLRDNILQKILSLNDDLVLMPGHGPPSTIAAEKRYNIATGCPLIFAVHERLSKRSESEGGF